MYKFLMLVSLIFCVLSYSKVHSMKHGEDNFEAGSTIAPLIMKNNKSHDEVAVEDLYVKIKLEPIYSNFLNIKNLPENAQMQFIGEHIKDLDELLKIHEADGLA